MGFEETLRFMLDARNQFGGDRAKFLEFFQIFMDFRKKRHGYHILERSEDLFRDERMVMRFYRLLLDTKRKNRKADDFRVNFKIIFKMMEEEVGKSHDDGIKLNANCSELKKKRTEGHIEVNSVKIEHDRVKQELDNTQQVGGRDSTIEGISKNEDHIKAVDKGKSVDYSNEVKKKSENFKRKREERNGRVDKDLIYSPRPSTFERGSCSSKKESNIWNEPISDPSLSSHVNRSPSFQHLDIEKSIAIPRRKRTKRVYCGSYSHEKINKRPEISFQREYDSYENNMLPESISATVKLVEERVRESTHEQ